MIAKSQTPTFVYKWSTTILTSFRIFIVFSNTRIFQSLCNFNRRFRAESTCFCPIHNLNFIIIYLEI